MDECFLYRNPPFSFPYAGLFNPLRMDNQFAITGPDGDGTSKKHEESKKRREKKRMSQILYSDNRRQRLNERLRAKLENRKQGDGEKSEIKPENTVLSEEDLVTLFDSEEAPKKRKRKKRKNRKKKKKAEKEPKLEEIKQQTSITIGETDIVSPEEISEPAIVEEAENTIEETPAELLKDSLESMISELSASPEISGEVEEKKFPPPLSLEKEEETLSQEEEETKSDDTGSIAGESTNSKEQEGEHLSCGESSTSSRDRSTSHEHDEIKEAGSTVSNEEGVSERQEEERSTISPEERGNLTEMILDDEFPWHLYLTEEDNSLPSSFSPRDDTTGFTVVRRKEKRIRKRKPSPPRKKKRRGERRRNRDRKLKDKRKDKNISAKKKTTPIKNSPRNACPIRPVIPTTPKEPTPPPPQILKKDPTLSTPSIPPGFGNQGNHIKCHQGTPSLTKPFEQMQAVNALFMNMPQNVIITIPVAQAMADGPEIYPMNLDLSYPYVFPNPNECTIPVYVFPNEAPIDTVTPQYS